MSEGTPKVGVGFIIWRQQDGKKQILLHKRLKKFGQGYWGSGGGKLELGETFMQTMLRELKEEAGSNIKVQNIEYIGTMNFLELPPDHFVDVSYSAEWVSGEPENESPEIATDWEWYDLDSLPSPLFPPVKKYLEMMASGNLFYDPEI